jgi:hypothetical protein
LLDPFTGLPPGVLAGCLPPRRAAAGTAAGLQHSGRHSGCAWVGGGGAAAPATADGASLPGSAGSSGGALSPTLAASLAGGVAAPPAAAAAAAAHLLLAAGGAPAAPAAAQAHPAGSAAAQRVRALTELHTRACLGAGLALSCARGTGGAAGPAGAVASYTIGPCGGLEGADQLTLSRFLLARAAEELGLAVAFAPAAPGCPGGGDGPRLAIEFSSFRSRLPGDGVSEMQAHICRLQACHREHAPGRAGGAARSAAHAPPAFTLAVGDRRAGLVIPTSTLAARCGPFVDRRAAGDCDPYLTVALLAAGALALPLPPAAAAALARRCAAGATAAAAAAAAAATAAALTVAAAAANAAPAPRWAPPAWPSSAAPRAVAPGGELGGSHGVADDGAALCGCCSDNDDSQDLLVSEICRIDRAAAAAAGAAQRRECGAGSRRAGVDGMEVDPGRWSYGGGICGEECCEEESGEGDWGCQSCEEGDEADSAASSAPPSADAAAFRAVGGNGSALAAVRAAAAAAERRGALAAGP